MTCLARRIFAVFLENVKGIEVYNLDCGCFYYQRIFSNADLDPATKKYRDAYLGPYQSCILPGETWKDMEAGFEAYVTTKQRTLRGIKENIYERLAESEHFLLFDFRREQIAGNSKSFYRLGES